jgi:hypothetical protein
MVGGKAKNAPQAVRDFGQLVIRHDPVIPGSRQEPSVEELYGLPNGNTFEEGLAVLIEIWGNNDAMRALRKHLALTREDKVAALLNDRLVQGEVLIGDARNSYWHPCVLRWFAGPGKQLDPSGNDSPAAWEKFVARYRSGIDSRKSVDTDLLRPLGEVVADLREPGSGIRDIDAEVRSYG